MTHEALIFDAWTALSFKRALGSRRTGGNAWAAPSWVPEVEQRRLLAYHLLQSYIDNAARVWLWFSDDDNDAEEREDTHREYGDAALIANTILTALLGEDRTIETEGADIDLESSELEPGEKAEAEAALALQEWLDKWAEAERLPLKVMETERNSVQLGDGVYVLGYSSEKRRVRLRTFDPGFYFPVLDDGPEDDYPDKVHLAWEIVEDTPRGDIIKVRRITYELRALPEPRNYPWNDEPSNVSCFMTDGTWTLSTSKGFNLNDLSEGKAEYARNGDGQEIKDLDLAIDFIPVIHIPNTVSLANHFGRAVLTNVLQILDDLANTDTDLQAAAATAGKPILALGGANIPDDQLIYRAGMIFQIGDGRMDALDTSKSLDALLKYAEALRDRLATNARTPDALLGRVKPQADMAGIMLLLTFGPLVALINEMRLVREEKYQLLFKFIWRISLSVQAPDVPKEWKPTRFVFGSYLPQDRASAVELVSKLYAAKLISLETALRMLSEVGVPIDEDVQDEIKAIEARDFEGAVQLLEALGSEKEVAEYLGRELDPTRPVAPVIQVPPPPAPAPEEVEEQVDGVV